MRQPVPTTTLSAGWTLLLHPASVFIIVVALGWPGPLPLLRAVTWSVGWLPFGVALALRQPTVHTAMAELRGAPTWDGASLCAALDLPPRLRLSACSAGQRRKAELVAALAADPTVLLLDEPFANVDAASVAGARGWLEEWAATRVVLLVTHEAPGLPVTRRAELRAGMPLSIG